MINFHDINDVHLAAVLVKTLLRELKEPVMTYDNYEKVLALSGLSNIL